MPVNRLEPVDSSHIAAVGYDAANRELVVEFRNGHQWSYAQVTPDEYAALRGAPSLGRAFNDLIKNPSNKPGKPATRI